MQIETVLLYERTLGSLVRSTTSAFGNSRESKANLIQINDIKFIPSIEQGILHIKSSVVGEQFHNYEVDIVMQGITFSDNPEEISGDMYKLVLTPETDYYVDYTSNSNNDVEIRCTCNDYRWRFAYYNGIDGSLYGELPPPYAGDSNSQPVNPTKSPGVCKHVMKVVNELEKEEFFRKSFGM